MSNYDTRWIFEVKVSEHNSIPRRIHGQVNKIPGQALHINTEYYADIRNRTSLAMISLHIQKLKPRQVS